MGVFHKHVILFLGFVICVGRSCFKIPSIASSMKGNTKAFFKF
jgi:hypothetical protein